MADADAEHRQELQAAKEQRDAQRQAERDLIVKGRLDAALSLIRMKGGSIPRSELTAMLVEKLSLSRPVVSRFISQMLKDGKLFESGKSVMDSENIVIPF